jgi:cytochrome P450
MLDHWTSLNGNGASRMSEDLRSISLNILAASAFGESYNFRQFNDNGAPDSYRDTLFMVHRYIVPLMLIPYRFLKPGIVPGQLAKIGTAANALQSFMRKLALDEVDALNMGKAASRGLIPSLASSLIRKTTIEMDAENNHNGGKRKMGLSIDEVCGNIFVMNFAGHDTTANVVTFIMVLLTAHPDVQQWLRDEIVEVTRGKPTEEWELSLWTHLKRCRAVLLETLRLYAPITGIPKRTSNRWQELRVGQQVLEIPPGIEIFPLLIGVQTDPTHWEDPYTWRPSRWIIKPQPGSSLQCENLVVQRKGVYFPWSAGPQNCIGQEFSQVETVAMLACIFGRYEVCSKRNIGETAEHARMKALACVDDVNYEMLLKMNQPDSIGLECSKILY